MVRGPQPFLVLAGGSNVIVGDDGYPGTVVLLRTRGCVATPDGDGVSLRVAAGEPWDGVVARTVAEGWSGIECLSGIPGSAGATPIQNVGAYGQDVSETIVRVEVLERATGRVIDLTNRECRFAYRSSIFKTTAKDCYVVISVTFRLRPGAPATVRYPELRAYLDDRGVTLDDLGAVREAVIAIRKRKGMVLDPHDPDTRSDGSFFMNPIVPPERVPEGAPHFPSPDGLKLSAAWLIEQAGFHKGFAHGNVGISTKHTLAIVNRAGGTAAEGLELVRMIQEGVRERFGVELQPEPVFVR